MATAHLLRRAASAFLSSTTTGPSRSRCPLSRLLQPRAAMATDSSAAPFQKIQIQREDTVRGPALTLSPPLLCPLVRLLSLDSQNPSALEGFSRVFRTHLRSVRALMVRIWLAFRGD